MAKPVRVYCSVHGAMLADDCVECQGEEAAKPEPKPKKPRKSD